MPENMSDLEGKLEKAITENNKIAILEIIKNKNMDINRYGFTNNPLLFAIENGKLELVKLFLAMGANPNASKGSGSAIDLACQKRNVAIIKCLLEDPRLKGVEKINSSDNSITIKFASSSGAFQSSYTLRDNTLTKNKLVPINEVDNSSLKNDFDSAVKRGDAEKIRSLLQQGYIYDDAQHLALKDALKSPSFETVRLLIERGAFILLDNAYETMWKEEGIPETFKKLLQLSKKKQIDIIAAFVKHDDPIQLDLAIQKINEDYVKRVDKLENLHKSNISILQQNLSELKNYINEFPKKRWKDTDKDLALVYITGFQSEINSFLSGTTDKKASSQNISKYLEKANNYLGKDRKTKDILAHVAFACTGIGLLILLGKKAFTGTFFLNQTKRQKILSAAEKKRKEVMPKPKH